MIRRAGWETEKHSKSIIYEYNLIVRVVLYTITLLPKPFFEPVTFLILRNDNFTKPYIFLPLYLSAVGMKIEKPMKFQAPPARQSLRIVNEKNAF